ncbi:MAG: hypothetical protein SFU98_00205 [Leptospiraceae bacterium]|nr:hypothetical protein [Leptospiraceae bacterium]
MKTSTQTDNHATKDDLKTLISFMDKRFEDMNRRFEDMYKYMDKRFEDVNRRFDDVNKRFEDIHKYMDKRFDDVNKRFDDINKKFNWNLWMVGILFTVGISIIGYQNQRAIDLERKYRSSTLKNLIEELESASPSSKNLLKKVLDIEN